MTCKTVVTWLSWQPGMYIIVTMLNMLGVAGFTVSALDWWSPQVVYPRMDQGSFPWTFFTRTDDPPPISRTVHPVDPPSPPNHLCILNSYQTERKRNSLACCAKLACIRATIPKMQWCLTYFHVYITPTLFAAVVCCGDIFMCLIVRHFMVTWL